MARNTPTFVVGESNWIIFNKCTINTIATQMDLGVLSFDATKDFYYRNNGTGNAWVKVIGGTYTTITIDYSDDDTIELFGNLTSLITITQDDNSEIVGVYYGNDFTDDDVIPEFEKGIFMVHPIVCELYTFDGEQSQVDKASDLTLRGYYIGAFREECEILTPSVLFEFNSFPTFNYVFIPSLSRFYFVTNITCVRSNIYRVDMKIDVLYSYMDDIYNQDAYVLRNENIATKSPFVDTRLPLIDKPIITYETITPSSSYVFDDSLTKTDYTIALFTNDGTVASEYPTTAPSPTGTNLPSVSRYVGNNPLITGYSTTQENWKVMADYIIHNSGDGSFLISAVAFPIKLNNFSYVASGLKPISLDGNSTGAMGYWLQASTSFYIDYGEYEDATIETDGEYEFLNHEPRTTYDVYLPYAEWTSLSSYDVVGCKIGFYYVLDLTNGNALIIIYNKTKSYVIKTLQVQIGILLSITKTNEEELQKQRQVNLINAIMGTLTGSMTMGLSGGFGQVKGVASGFTQVAKSVVGQITSDMMMIDRASSSPVGDMLGLFTPKTNVIVRKTTHMVASDFSDSDYRALNGYVVNNVLSLSSISGYTEIGEMHYIPQSQTNITIREIDEIISLARKGIIL